MACWIFDYALNNICIYWWTKSCIFNKHLWNISLETIRYSDSLIHNYIRVTSLTLCKINITLCWHHCIVTNLYKCTIILHIYSNLSRNKSVHPFRFHINVKNISCYSSCVNCCYILTSWKNRSCKNTWRICRTWWISTI